jgi:hypothetical protein
MGLNEILNSYLGKNVRYSEKDMGNGSKQVCDLDTGDCYVVRMKDGLIERFDNSVNMTKKVRVETPQGVKQLLND